MKPDHEAAKKLAKALIEAGCQGEHHANLVNAYLDLVAREQRAVKLLQGVAELERELEAARMVCDFMEIVAAGPDFHLNDYTRTIQEKAKAVLAAYRATKEKTDG